MSKPKTKMLKGTTIFGKEVSKIKKTALKFHKKVTNTLAGPGKYVMNKIKKKN
tara:strand:+ start:382 stop:540 length:159 start_codon:yes stop_codon:yes gene_type:complete